MPQTGQERDLPRFRSLPCAVYLRAFEMPAGHRVEMHEHPWGQLMYAASGTLRASTERHSYLVPAQRALWIPPGVRHAAEACNPVLFRSLYLDRSLPGGCRVLEVSGLLRELLLRAAEFPREYPPGGEAERLMQVVADEVGRLREAPLNLPLPGDPRLRRITDALQADPADPRGISDWAGLVGASRRTLARLFREQTQLSFREWRQRLRLLNAHQPVPASFRPDPRLLRPLPALAQLSRMLQGAACRRRLAALAARSGQAGLPAKRSRR